MASGRGSSGNSLPERDTEVVGEFARISDGETRLKGAGALFKKQDAEDFVVDLLLDKRGTARQHFVQPNRCVRFFADFADRREPLGGTSSISVSALYIATG